MAKLYWKRDLPPCPDPDIYIVFKYGDKWGWKKKRGTDKKVQLNESFQRNSNNMSVSSPAAKELLQKLAPFLKEQDDEHRIANIGGLLMRGLNKTGVLDYTALYGFEFNAKHTLKSMFSASFKLDIVNDHASFSCRVSYYHVMPPNTLATQFFLELILLQGEMLSDHGLRVESDVSGLMDFNTAFNTEVALSLLLPETSPWMLVLRLSCFEGKEMGRIPKLHRLRVIASGRGRNIEMGRQEFEKFL
jgi:hypothetical protein